MRFLILLIALNFIGTTKAQDTAKLYLTIDLAINNNLLIWEQIEKETLHNLESGAFRLYSDSSLSNRLKGGDLLDRLRFHYFDSQTGKEERGPRIEEFVFIFHANYLELVTQNPFNEKPARIGYSSLKFLKKSLNDNHQNWLELMMAYSNFGKESVKLDYAKMYTYSRLAFDAIQKRMHDLSMGHVQLYNEVHGSITDTAAGNNVMEHKDFILQRPSGDSLVVNWVPIPETQKWKGLLIEATLEDEELQFPFVGLLIHPETKYAGFNPGKIMWYSVKLKALSREDRAIGGWIQQQARLSLLYSIEPERYKAEFFRSNGIDIHNSRY